MLIVDNDNEPRNSLSKVERLGKLIRAGVIILLLVALFALSFVLTTCATENGPTAPPIHKTISATTSPACEIDATALAEYHTWHGSPSHPNSAPYTSTNPAVITRHIISAQAQCIDGFVVDWYGPPDGPDDIDREFMDQAFAELLSQAEMYNFKVGIMYDEGALRGASPFTMTRVISDLLYATKYFTSSAYLSIDEKPALFIFPYPDIDPDINWQTLRQQLPTAVTLLDEDPNPADPTHDSYFDGFYAWVQPSGGGWKDDCTEWGKDYLYWFYNTMASPTYSNKVAVGGVWPGFDDTLAFWGSNRCMCRCCGQTWLDTWGIFNEFAPDYVMIDTWNDFEEGTDIEYGIGECIYLPIILASSHN